MLILDFLSASLPGDDLRWIARSLGELKSCTKYSASCDWPEWWLWQCGDWNCHHYTQGLAIEDKRYSAVTSQAIGEAIPFHYAIDCLVNI